LGQVDAFSSSLSATGSSVCGVFSTASNARDSGTHFTYLPIVYEDDCQVFLVNSEYQPAPVASYVIRIEFK